MPSSMSGIRAVLRNNRWLKVAALLLAIILWYAIREAISSEAMIKNVRLNVVTEDGWAVLDQSVPDVDVLFRGSEEDLRYLNRDQIEVKVNMRGRRSREGTVVVSLSPDHVKAPAGARAIRVDPNEITLSLDRKDDKEVPVKAEVMGTPPEDYEVSKVVCTPATVVVHGPRQRLAMVNVVRTEPIDLEGRLRSFNLKRSIAPLGTSWSARVEPETVDVRVSIVQRTTRTDIENVRVSALVKPNSRDGVQFWPPTVRVTLSGRTELIGNVQKDRLLAFVDCSSLERGSRVSLPVRVPVGAGLDVVAIDPPMVSAEIEPAQVESP
ncbi:MAG: CdaR family protein [bacterium]